MITDYVTQCAVNTHAAKSEFILDTVAHATPRPNPSATVFVSTGLQERTGYDVYIVDLRRWVPSEADLASAMLRYEQRRESIDEFKEQLFQTVIHDVDGV